MPVLAHAWRHPPRTRHALLEVRSPTDTRALFVLHLRAWFSKWSEQRRARELRGLLDGIRSSSSREENAFAFHLLAGDFNALAPGERFDPSPMPAWIRGMVWLSGRDIARSTIEMMPCRRLRGRVAHRASGRRGTSQATPFRCGGRTCGWTTCSRRPRTRRGFRACEVRRTPESVRRASDHFPLLVEITER